MKFWKAPLTAALTAIMAFVIVYPLLLTVSLSLRGDAELLLITQSQAAFTLRPDTVSPENYYNLLLSLRFNRGFLNQLFYTASITAMQLAFGVSAAFVLTKFALRGARLIYRLYVLGMLLPFSAVLLPQYRLITALRLYDTPWAVLLPGCFGSIGVFYFRQLIKQIPDAMLEAASLDGANPPRLLMRFVLPNIQSGLVVFCLLSIGTHWNSTEAPQAFLLNEALHPLSLLVLDAYTNYPPAYFAPAVLGMLIPLGVYGLFAHRLAGGLSLDAL